MLEEDGNVSGVAKKAVVATSPATALLSGRTFKKESGRLHTPHAEVRSVEMITFGPGDRFHFTHRFWRGRLLRRRFDCYGTYTIVPLASNGRDDDSVIDDLQLEDLVAAVAGGENGTDLGAVASLDEGGRLRERTECKVILRWPSKFDAPELRDWQFDLSYSHLYLAAATAAAAAAASTLVVPSSSSDDAASVVPSASSVVASSSSSSSSTRKRPHFLYTKHSAVFVEDAC